jgi:hypothetical protein
MDASIILLDRIALPRHWDALVDFICCSFAPRLGRIGQKQINVPDAFGGSLSNDRGVWTPFPAPAGSPRPGEVPARTEQAEDVFRRTQGASSSVKPNAPEAVSLQAVVDGWCARRCLARPVTILFCDRKLHLRAVSAGIRQLQVCLGYDKASFI